MVLFVVVFVNIISKHSGPKGLSIFIIYPNSSITCGGGSTNKCGCLDLNALVDVNFCVVQLLCGVNFGGG